MKNRLVFGLFACVGLGLFAEEPRKTVLLLGDSIRLGYCADVKELLKDIADVRYPEENGRFAYYTLRMICEWTNLVEDPKAVDVVHFNNGLWDLGQRDGRECLTPVGIYEVTMSRIADEIRHYFPNAKLIFATTTPVNEAVFDSWHAKGNAEVVKYNEAALKALTGKIAAVDDLYSFVRDHEIKRCYKDIVHYTPEGSKFLAQKVSVSILSVLKDCGRNRVNEN